NVLKQVLQRFHNAGWRPVVAAELEFSLLRYDSDGVHHSCTRVDGGTPLGGNLYGLDVLHEQLDVLQDIRAACAAQGLPFDGIVKESAPSQYEINMQHIDNPVLAADQLLMIKRLVKGVAARHGLVASFMAKPFADEAGNGMHLHCSILDEQDNNIFDDGGPAGTELLRHAVAGSMRYMGESMAIFAPNVNSYRRFQPGAHAPTSPCWGYDNRTVSVRIPAGKPAARRIELRVAGADANPYLLYAVMLSAIMEGIAQQLDPGAPVEGDGYEQATDTLPEYLPEALRLFESSAFIERNLGAELQRIYASSKWQENAEFRRLITDFEYSAYLEKL
ncbi:MAG: glutamine synthetase family protein, partial [Halieaceae bacterium]|nr:glutamine synthetase family protein [Halieaceae bacterium]